MGAGIYLPSAWPRFSQDQSRSGTGSDEHISITGGNTNRSQRQVWTSPLPDHFTWERWWDLTNKPTVLTTGQVRRKKIQNQWWELGVAPSFKVWASPIKVWICSCCARFYIASSFSLCGIQTEFLINGFWGFNLLVAPAITECHNPFEKIISICCEVCLIDLCKEKF